MKHIRAIFNKTIVFILSVCLLNLNVQVTTGGVTFSSQSAMADTSQVEASKTVDESGKVTKSINADLDGKKGGFTSSAMTLVTMMAIGYIGSRLFMTCKNLPMDMMIAAAGAAAYIIGEILAFSSFKKMKKKTMAIAIAEDGEVDNVQVEALNAQKKLYQDVIKTANTKKMLQMAAASAFGIAAIKALYESMSELTLETASSACPTVIPAVAAKKAKDAVPTFSIEKGPVRIGMCRAISVAAAAGASAVVTTVPCTAVLTSVEMLNTQCMANTAICDPTVESFSDSSQGFSDGFIKYAAASIDMELSPSNALMSYEISNENIENNSMDSLGKLMANFSSILIPQANASAGALGFVGAGLAVFMATKGVMAQQLDMYWANPQSRGIAYGVITAATAAAMSQTSSVIETAEANIEKIDGILAIANNLAEIQQINSTTPTDIGLQILPVNGVGFTVPKDAIILSDNKTPCVKAGSTSTTCGSVKTAIESDKSFDLMGSNFGALASLTGAVADGLSGTSNLSSSTLSSAANLANSSGAINKHLEKQKRKLNKQREKQGRKPVDFEKLENDLLNSMAKNTAKALRLKNSDASSLMASIGQTTAPTKSKVAKVKKSNVKPVAAVRNSARAGGYKFKPSGINFDLGDDQITNDEMDENSDQLASAKDLNEDHGDIVENPDVSIFNVISVRYMKSGYSRLLEKKNK